MSEFLGHFPCLSCPSSDALAISQDDEGLCFGQCFSCGENFAHNKIAKALGDQLGIEVKRFKSTGRVKDDEEEEYIKIVSKEPLTEQEQQTIREQSFVLENQNFRGITPETNHFYRVRYEANEDGTLRSQLYPILQNGNLVGYKERILPKDFFQRGKNGKDCELFGAFRFKKAQRTIVLTGGEIDAMSLYQVLKEHTDSRNRSRNQEFDPIPVVSPTIGETCVGQIKANYDYLCQFDRIVLAFDNDEAGLVATDKVAKILPKEKVYQIRWTGKDPNEMLQAGKTKDIIDDYYRAEKYVPKGITSSANIEDAMMEYVSIPRIGLPPHLCKLQNMLRGGFPVGQIVSLLAASGVGKTSAVDSMTLHWIMNDSRKVGIVALEASEGEYGVNLSSAYCGKKVNLLETVEERVEYLQRPENVAKRKELWTDENGDPRFYLVDADVENMQAKIEYLIKVVGCKIIILDPISDIFDMLDDAQQRKWMKWQKDVVKRDQVTMLNIVHARKSGSGQKANSRGADLSEEDMMGTSALFKSSGINIVITRDKEAEDEFERNTTKWKITKARGVGNTGLAGETYYCNETHRAYDVDWYLKNIKGEEEEF